MPVKKKDTDRALVLLEDYCKKLKKPEEQQLKRAIKKVMGIFKSSLFQALLATFTAYKPWKDEDLVASGLVHLMRSHHGHPSIYLTTSLFHASEKPKKENFTQISWTTQILGRLKTQGSLLASCDLRTITRRFVLTSTSSVGSETQQKNIFIDCRKGLKAELGFSDGRPT